MIISRDCKSLFISFMLVTISMHVSAMIQESSLTDKDLLLAAMNDNSKLVKQCLDAEINVDVADQFGNTALTLASGRGHTDVVNLLIERKADVAVENQRRSTALMLASGKGYTDIVDSLLKQKADVKES